jgi:hypothetical protein
VVSGGRRYFACPHPFPQIFKDDVNGFPPPRKFASGLARMAQVYAFLKYITGNIDNN